MRSFALVLSCFLFVSFAAANVHYAHAEPFSGKEFFIDSMGRPVFASYEATPAKDIHRLDTDETVHHVACVDGGLMVEVSHGSELLSGTENVLVGGRKWSCDGSSVDSEDVADFVHHRPRRIIKKENLGGDRIRIFFDAGRIAPEKLFESTKMEVRIGLTPEQERRYRQHQSSSSKLADSADVTPIDAVMKIQGVDSLVGLEQLDASKSASVSFGWNYEDGAVKDESIELFKSSWWTMTCDNCYVYAYAGIVASIETSWGLPVNAEVRFEGSLDVNFDYTLVFGNQFDQSDYKQFFKMDLGTVVVPIGGVPVTITPYFSAGAGYKFEIGGDVTVKWGLNYRKSMELGYKWDKNDGVSKIFSMEGGLTLKEPTPSWEFSAKGEIYVQMGLGVKIWSGVADMSVSLYPGVYLSAKKASSDSLGISLTANADIAAKGSIGIPKIATFRKNFGPIWYYNNLYRDEWTYALPFNNAMNKAFLKADVPNAPRMIMSSERVAGGAIGEGKSIPASGSLCPEVVGSVVVNVGVNNLGSSSDGVEIFGDILCGYKNTRQKVFEFTAPADGLYEFNTTNSDFDTILSLRTPTYCGRELTCNDDLEVYSTLQSRIVAPINAGEKRLIVVGGYNNASGNIVLNIEQSPPSYREIFVDEINGDDTKNGSSTEPMATVAAAIAWATICPEKIIHVTLLPGHFSINQQINFNLLEDNVLTVKSKYGAPFGHGSAEDTIIDCNFMGRFAYINETTHVTFRGLTVQNCRAQNTAGGAIKVEGGSMRAEDVHFTWNFVAGDADKAMGGAVSVHNTAEIIFVRCLFDENSAQDGGAIAIAENGKAELSACVFRNNQAARGGAVMLGSVKNSTYDAGAVFDDCIFDDNSALFGDSIGGAIFSMATDLPFLVHHSNFTDNWAVVGGAIFSYDAGFTAEHCNFLYNAAWDGTNSYGFDPCGGAAAVSGFSDITWGNITHSYFRANTGMVHGGALCIFDGAKIYIADSDLDDNWALPFPDAPSVASGGALWCKSGHFEVGPSNSLNGNSFNPMLRTWNNTNTELEAGCTSNWAPCGTCDMCYECGVTGCGTTEISCNDGDPMTTDVCEPRLGCVSKADYAHASVSDVTPGFGPVAGGTRIHIVGTDLGEDANDVVAIVIGGFPCGNITWVSSTELYADTPNVPMAGGFEVRVITQRGGGGDSFARFQYIGSNSDTRLGSISVNGIGGLDFNPDVHEYNLTSIPRYIDIMAEPISNTSVVTINGVVGVKNLKGAIVPGADNTIVVTVTSDDQRYSTEYTMKVTPPTSGGVRVVLGLGWVLLALLLAA